jgi:DNA processing protein
MNERIFGLNLLHQQGVGAKTFIKLISEAGGIVNLYENTLKLKPLKYHQKYLLSSQNAVNAGSKYMDILDKLAINFYYYFDSNYPALLKEIHDYPAIIYYKGNIDLINKEKIAIVGTRSPTNYGEDQTKFFAKNLSYSGYVIVSGMAMGIDKIAHETTVKEGGLTIAVLAGSVNKSSPLINQKTYDSILSNNGLIISEYSPFTKISPGMFASRNRIISGISKGVVVVEAPIKSGSLITADLALEQGREVFSIPSNINSKKGEGTNNLIKEGKAKLIQNIKDITEELTNGYPQKNEIQGLSIDENKIYTSITQGYSTIDELSITAGLDLGATINICTTLEIKNLIKKDFSGKYMLV